MKKVKNVIVGFGKGGKTLAKRLASEKEEVLVIEKSPEMYGGTCINIGCIPSKALICGSETHIPFTDAVSTKDKTVSLLRNKNYHMLNDNPLITVVDGTARFVSNTILEVASDAMETYQIEAERIFINTGSVPVPPPSQMLQNSPYLIDSTQAMSLTALPSDLVIIGAGYIGLEFASMFKAYGSNVTILDEKEVFLPREDRDIANTIYDTLTDMGISINMGVTIGAVDDYQDHALVTYITQDELHSIRASKILGAIGRKPNTDDLCLEHTDIKRDRRGAIIVDAHLKTTAPNIWALGDVKGGQQFTYISLDDFRIVEDDLFGDHQRTTENRTTVPYTLFITPPLSRVGLTEQQALEQNIDYQVFKQPLSAIPKAHVSGNTKGLFKILIDRSTNQIIGASLFGIESHEMINLITLAMDLKLDYRLLRDRIYTHPTITESLNDILK
ncbi:FAD-dependent oxidoreductase [Erysipelothrix rhusiopathiae]|uniref:FAD-dependent oxidoreductase n=1 Tax=Erysipelothrix rhusiopathiae TaxID=1648 RepID=UPI002B247384|nr:FAD-dependent oxidoreductase [Erysipelothrix rhusiopathiae]WRB93060.1 FAD-dependent oxidoreductase [Erysipelothrix rhusiopathiae]